MPRAVGRNSSLGFALALALGLGPVGCAGALSGPAKDATTSVVTTLDDPAVKKQIDDLATSAVTTSRDVLLDDETLSRMRLLVTVMLEEVRAEVARIKADVLRNLDNETRVLVSVAIDQATQQAAALREELVGPGFKDDLSKALAGALDDAGPHLTRALAAPGLALRADVEAEAAKWKWLALGLAGLVTVLIALHVHAVHALRAALPPRGSV